MNWKKILKFIGKQLYILFLATVFSFLTATLIIQGNGMMIMKSTNVLGRLVIQACVTPTRGA
jgi:hypothetical protein